MTRKLFGPLLGALIFMTLCRSASSGALPAEAQTYIKLRYGGDLAQSAAVTQLAHAYLEVADAPSASRLNRGELMAQAVTLVRAERCVTLRFAASGTPPSTVMHNVQRALLTSPESIEGWNSFVEAYKGQMPPRVSGDTCE